MFKFHLLVISIFTVLSIPASAQNFPYERPLKMAWSANGITFSTPTIFQDSSGVPSVVRWKGDTLVCAFQWFRAPVGSLTWDRVAVKFSYDNGLTWTQPNPIVVNGLPNNYQRPFDPTLLVFNDSLRIYFSSSNGMPIGLDSTVNTYSAISADGINYLFDANARVDEQSNRVIDPAVIHYSNSYHYLGPIGSPQQGAYHYISPDGLNFSKVPDVPSDMNHNWTGNYVINSPTELRFYGAGTFGIWFNSTPNGGMWNGYVNTNIIGGDPSVVKIDSANYLIIYVGEPYSTGIHETLNSAFSVKPNPTSGVFTIHFRDEVSEKTIYISDESGKLVYVVPSQKGFDCEINLTGFSRGTYFVQVFEKDKRSTTKIILE